MAVIALATSSAALAVPIVHTTDFINDSGRTHFNGFESIPNDGTFFTGGAGPYVEDSISVTQINPDPPNDIWIGYSSTGRAGNLSWYPNGADNGYTEIALAGGIDFDSVGFNYGTGGFASAIYFELLDNGNVVLSGSAALSRSSVNYLGFSGGGFDTIRVRDNFTDSAGTSVTDGSEQALAIDSIETLSGPTDPVPEPGSLALAGMALLGVSLRRRRAR